jgi:hypothetical protein
VGDRPGTYAGVPFEVIVTVAEVRPGEVAVMTLVLAYFDYPTDKGNHCAQHKTCPHFRPMRAFLRIIGVVLVTGFSCSRDRPSSTTTIAPLPSNTTSITTQTSSTAQFVVTLPSTNNPPVTSVESSEILANEASAAKVVEQFVSKLRAAFLANEKKDFAALLTYPLIVNTTSRCTALIPDPATFVAHFDEITGGPLASALRSKTPEIFTNGYGTSFGNGRIWFDAYGKTKPEILSINADTFRIGKLPCAGEPEEPVPEWFHGTWYVTSVASLQGGQMVPRSPTTWIGKSIDIDLPRRTVSLNVSGENQQKCFIDRFASRRSGQVKELTAAYARLIHGKRTRFLDLICHKADQQYIERLEVINPTAIALVGDDKYLLVLRQNTNNAGTDETKGKRISCGTKQDICPTGQTCFASLNSKNELVESCAVIE